MKGSGREMGDLTVGIVCKPTPGVTGLPILADLVAWCRQRGYAMVFEPVAASLSGEAHPLTCERPVLPGEVDLIVVLGGDGTLLSVARHLGAKRVPILGVNLGHLGFLTEIPTGEMIATLEAFTEGKAPVQQRMMIHARLESGGSHVASFHCLNDAVLTTSALARMIEVRVEVEERWLTDMRADGVILATPTGSTAYNLSAGGPIVTPGLEAVILAPICPHTLTMRPLVLEARRPIAVTLLKGEDVMLTADGQKGARLQVGDKVRVARSDHGVPLVTSPGRDYFALLREKLGWGIGRTST
jgi:NAD+ kinase